MSFEAKCMMEVYMWRQVKLKTLHQIFRSLSFTFSPRLLDLKKNNNNNSVLFPLHQNTSSWFKLLILVF